MKKNTKIIIGIIVTVVASALIVGAYAAMESQKASEFNQNVDAAFTAQVEALAEFDAEDPDATHDDAITTLAGLEAALSEVESSDDYTYYDGSTAKRDELVAEIQGRIDGVIAWLNAWYTGQEQPGLNADTASDDRDALASAAESLAAIRDIELADFAGHPTLFADEETVNAHAAELTAKVDALNARIAELDQIAAEKAAAEAAAAAAASTSRGGNGGSGYSGGNGGGYSGGSGIPSDARNIRHSNIGITTWQDSSTDAEERRLKDLTNQQFGTNW